MTTNFEIPEPQSEDDVHNMIPELVDAIMSLKTYCVQHDMNRKEIFLLYTAAHNLNSFHQTIDIQELLSGKSTAHHSN